MIAETLAIALRVAAAASAAIVLVLALRPLARRAFGSIATYRLWLLVPISSLASQLPARVVEVATTADVSNGASMSTIVGAAPREFGADAAPPLLDLGQAAFAAAAPVAAALWIGGALVSLFFLFRQHARQLATIRDGRAAFGPAAIGVAGAAHSPARRF